MYHVQNNDKFQSFCSRQRKKNDCAPNHRYNLWNLLRKRYIFERRFFSSFSLGIFFMGFSFCRFVQCSIPFGFYLSFLLLFLLSANFLGRFSVCVHSNGKSNGNIARSISPVGNTNLFEARYFCFSLYHFSTKIYEKTLQCIELASFCYLINATVDTHWKMPNRKIRNVFAVLFSLSFSFLHVNQISNK